MMTFDGVLLVVTTAECFVSVLYLLALAYTGKHSGSCMVI